MSGIVGIISKEAENQKKIIDEMLEAIKHRGGQYKNIIIDKNAIIGFYSDLSKVVEHENIYLFTDGLIYNRPELTKLIAGKDTSLLSDEDVLLNLYIKYGTESFELINGDFVLVIWDSIKRVLVISKYLSINKNIYYCLNKDGLIFASEIKSLLFHPEVKKDLDIESINNFLTFRHIPSPYTIFNNVRRLKPASVITYNNELKEKNLCYFKIKKVYDKSEKQILRELYFRLEAAVIKRLNRVKDIGLFLSGGLDSSALLYFLNKKSEETIKTYTVSLLRDGPFARAVANYFKCKHAEYKISIEDLINVLPKALWHFEYPVNGPDSFLYYLPKISEGQKYIFWGRGAEEVFYGRLDYIVLNAIVKFKKILPLKLWQVLKDFSCRIPNKNILYKLLNIILAEDIYDIYISFREVLTKIEKEELLDEKVFKYDPKLRLIPYMEFNQDFLEKYSYLTLVNGFWSDTFLNTNQEILNPYMDKDFISYAYSIPSNLKIRRGQTRYLLKKMMSDKLPDFILERKKDNWHAQTDFLVNREKGKYYHIINRLRERGILKFDISSFFKKYKFKADEKFWALLSLEILLEIFLDCNKAEEPPYLDKF